MLINIVKEQLPQGLEAWRNVATLYQSAANKKELRRGEDIRDNWVRKLCNNFKSLQVSQATLLAASIVASQLSVRFSVMRVN
jgi:hypothetical protein